MKDNSRPSLGSPQYQVMAHGLTDMFFKCSQQSVYLELYCEGGTRQIFYVFDCGEY